DAFEHITIRGNVPEATRREPNTVGESRAMMQDARARVFVLFLDINHVEIEASHRIRQPLTTALERLIGPDDLVGVMTPEMSARDVTFARKTTTIEGILSRYWTWGERDRLNAVDPEQEAYKACYPGTQVVQCPDGTSDDDRGVADEMIVRRQEKQTLDALEDLVGYLRGVREERKAVIAITDGWLLYQPDPNLSRKLYCNIPTAGVYIDPRTGKMSTKPPDNSDGSNDASCERDRMMLANIDDRQQYRRLLDEANRANTSFYPVDPRGLAVFDTSIHPNTTGLPVPGSPPVTPPSVDAAMLSARLTSLRTLAESTDGLAIVNSNNLDAGMQRIVADLSSYYLLGYYSTGRLDGKFHSISVRVKRPGVQVRARRGFLAAKAGDVATTARVAPALDPEAAAAAEETHAIASVLAPLAGFARDLPLRLLASAGWRANRAATVWLVAEAGHGQDWMGGGEASAMLLDHAGATVATAEAAIDPGARSVRLTLAPASEVPPGEYEIQLRVKGVGSAAATTDSTRVSIAAAPGPTGALFLRRGPTTGNRDVPTADLRFHRSEHLTIEVPSVSSDPVHARLLDRTGKPLKAIPVAGGTRADADGTRWNTAQLSLVPLGVGDYVIELTSGSGGTESGAAAGEVRTLAAFRIVP
ncbi:MAG TPA: VWA domain-containing protein, partial [Vicinamibacterales bacterium]|nr:VWA domain-containing protein [Vicinamibacterales bacterium]